MQLAREIAATRAEKATIHLIEKGAPFWSASRWPASAQQQHWQVLMSPKRKINKPAKSNGVNPGKQELQIISRTYQWVLSSRALQKRPVSWYYLRCWIRKKRKRKKEAIHLVERWDGRVCDPLLNNLPRSRHLLRKGWPTDKASIHQCPVAREWCNGRAWRTMTVFLRLLLFPSIHHSACPTSSSPSRLKKKENRAATVITRVSIIHTRGDIYELAPHMHTGILVAVN